MKDSIVTVIARFKAKEGMTERLKQELMHLVELTRSEAGCINYDLHQSPDDKALFLFHENWSSKEALDAHSESAHVKRFRKLAVELIEERELTFWEHIG